MVVGEAAAWEALSRLDPADVCRRALATYDKPAGHYVLRCFDQDIRVSPAERRLSAGPGVGDCLLGRLATYSTLPILWYLIGAQDVPVSGRLVRPADIKGGLIYERGTHALPLGRLAEKYGHDPAAFVGKARDLDGLGVDYGDAAVRLRPLPRVPVVIILWQTDGEFSPRASLLFDSTCELHLRPDVIWSTAMMSVLIMLDC